MYRVHMQLIAYGRDTSGPYENHHRSLQLAPYVTKDIVSALHSE